MKKMMDAPVTTDASITAHRNGSQDLLICCFQAARIQETDVDVQLRWVRRQTAYTEEARLMELLADEEADVTAIPDDGELEGSGDDFYC